MCSSDLSFAGGEAGSMYGYGINGLDYDGAALDPYAVQPGMTDNFLSEEEIMAELDKGIPEDIEVNMDGLEGGLDEIDADFIDYGDFI